MLSNNLPYLLDYFSKKNYDFEIIISDDGSKDSDVVEKISREYNCKYLKSGNNMGKGSALKNGIFNSSGAYRIFTDADIPYNGADIDNIITSLQKDNFDMVIGDRTLLKSSYYKNISFIRSFGSKIFSSIVGGITSGKFNDTQCGLKGFTEKCALDLFGKSKINGFAIDVELIYLALRKNYTVKKIPVTLRKQGVSTVKIIKHGILMLIDLIKIKVYQVTRKYD